MPTTAAAYRYAVYQSPVGTLLAIGTPTALVELRLPADGAEHRDYLARRYPRAIEDTARFARLFDELDRYFGSEQVRFTEPLAPAGTPFQQAVWERLSAIPRGQTVSYGRVTADVGRPQSSARAVGQAVGANPIAIVIPCHRVLAANGKLNGYAGGLEMKRRLLQIEGILAL